MTAPHAHSFGDLLHRHRMAAGLTQEELAERAGLSARAVSDIERGVKARPHRETVRLLAAARGLDGPRAPPSKPPAVVSPRGLAPARA